MATVAVCMPPIAVVQAMDSAFRAVRLWERTAFAGRFDSTVFSCTVGLRKPDPRIYRLCLRELGVEAGDTLFVGDGANDELAGAVRAGLRAVLIHRPGEEPIWPEARMWDGPRVTSIPEVLDHVDHDR